ncbi:MAG: NAD(P)-dependent oxidoreductase [Anaerolineae bacterium]
MTAAPNTYTVLVTGAGGFVLRSVVDVLAAAGCRVLAVDRQFPPALRARWAASSVELIEADAAALPPCRGVDTLILGAATTAAPEEIGLTPEAYFEQEMELFLHGLSWAQAHDVRRVIVFSSAAVYAQSDGPIDEDRPTQPLGLYAVVKASVEALCRTLKTLHGRDCVAVRLSGVYGPEESASATRPRISLVGQMIHDALTTGRIHPVEEPARDWTFVGDIGHAILALVHAPQLKHAVYNLASEQRATPLEIARLLQALLPTLTIAPPAPAPTPLTRRGWLSHQRLAADTGFQRWTPLAEGLRHALETTLTQENAP